MQSQIVLKKYFASYAVQTMGKADEGADCSLNFRQLRSQEGASSHQHRAVYRAYLHNYNCTFIHTFYADFVNICSHLKNTNLPRSTGLPILSITCIFVPTGQ